MIEIWKPIEGFEGLYEVSNVGQIKGLKRNKLLKPAMQHQGYKFVLLYKECLPTTCYIHIAVCTAFNGSKPFPEAQALHKDDIKSNNTPENLYWGTHQQNMQDAMRNGRTQRGSKSKTAKLTWDQINEIRSKAAKGTKMQELSHEYKVGLATIYNIVRNKSWVT